MENCEDYPRNNLGQTQMFPDDKNISSLKFQKKLRVE